MDIHRALVYPVTLYYDGSCRLCSGEMRNLRAHDTAGRLAFVDCSPEGFTGGPAPRAALMTTLHAVDAAGRVYTGIESFRVAHAAIGLPTISALLGLPGLSQAAARAYPVLARHRHRLPAWLVEPFLERAARRAARRAASCRDGACTLPGRAGSDGGR
jgi:predicted DCC family thiol-disulfide oxidoreductase YuxK